MATKTYLHALNVGIVDGDKQHRIDLERMRLAADQQENWQADAVGKAFFRPGFGKVAETAGAARGRCIPFVAGPTDSFVLELTDLKLRVIDCDNNSVVGSTFNSGGINVTNPGFTAVGGGWTLNTAAGQTSVMNNRLELQARAHGADAHARQSLAVDGVVLQPLTEYICRIIVERGPVGLRIGSTDGSSELLPFGQEMTLRTGTHYIAFVSGAAASTVYIRLVTTAPVSRRVTSFNIEPGTFGNPDFTMELPTPWPLAVLGKVRISQSLDVTFVTCVGYRPMRIERHGDRAWSICNYTNDDGPFLPGATADLTLTPGALEGNTTLTSSRNFFQAGHVGALMRLTHDGQMIDTYLAGASQFTPAIEVTGITETNFEERKWGVTISGTWAGTIRTQRSFDDPDFGYHDMRRAQTVATIDITANATYTNDDNDDNAIEWVRYIFQAYTSGEARIQVTYPGGAGTGICRITSYNSPTSVNIEILSPFSGTAATKNWQEGAWSDVQGWPRACLLADGRLWFAGSDQVWASVSDAYESQAEALDQDGTIGDSSAFSRSIALGGRNEGQWLVGLISPIIGTDARIAQVRASSLDEIITPENLGIRTGGKVGAAAVSPAELADDRALFVERAGNRLYEISWSGDKARYVVNPFSKLTTKVFKAGITSLDVQTLPDQRIWATIDDGSLVCIVFEPTQDVICFLKWTTRPGDKFQSVCVVPGAGQDRVYVTTERVTAAGTSHFVEQLALDTEAVPGTVCKCVDAFVVLTGNGTASITDSRLEHLQDQAVCGWAAGTPLTDPAITDPNDDDTWTGTVTGTTITLPYAVDVGVEIVVGLPYTARYRSARLAYGVPGMTPMSAKQKIAGVGILLGDYVRSGFRFGTQFDNPLHPLQRLPLIHGGTGDDAPEIVEGEDAEEPLRPTDSEIKFDTRLCVEVKSPKPATMLGIVLAVETF